MVCGIWLRLCSYTASCIILIIYYCIHYIILYIIHSFIFCNCIILTKVVGTQSLPCNPPQGTYAYTCATVGPIIHYILGH